MYLEMTLQPNERNLVWTPNGQRIGSNISPVGSNNPAYNNALNRFSRNNVSNTGHLLYSSSTLRTGAPPTNTVTHHNVQFIHNMRKWASLSSILASNLRRGGVHGTSKQRHKTVDLGESKFNLQISNLYWIDLCQCDFLQKSSSGLLELCRIQ